MRLPILQLGDFLEQVFQIIVLDLVGERRNQRLGLVGILAT